MAWLSGILSGASADLPSERIFSYISICWAMMSNTFDSCLRSDGDREKEGAYPSFVISSIASAMNSRPSKVRFNDSEDIGCATLMMAPPSTPTAEGGPSQCEHRKQYPAPETAYSRPFNIASFAG